MVPFEISGAVASLKAAKDLLKVGIDAKADAQAKDKVNEVLDKLGEAQDTLYELRAELFRLQGENEKLIRDASDKTEWKNRLAQYSLWQSSRAGVVYKFNGEPEHYACPTCINEERIEVLQWMANGNHICPKCKSAFKIFPVKPSPPPQKMVNPWHDPYKREW